MAEVIKQFTQFAGDVASRHQYAQGWKERTGNKVMGYFCTYVPEEIIYAAGILPVRVLGSHEPQDVTEAHIATTWCPHCRDCLAQVLLGRYDYVDGITITSTCRHIAQSYDSWQKHRPISFSYDLCAPMSTSSPHAHKYFRTELAGYQQALEKWLGKTIPDADLDHAIQVYNTSRRLMKEVYELRKAARPPISGAEAQGMVLASQLMDKEEHNRLLEEALPGLRQASPNGGDPGVRLMLLGSENDDLTLVEFIESLGSQVVIDDHCTGSRYFYQEVVPQEDRLAALATRCLTRPPCPNKDMMPDWRRAQHVLGLARDYNVQGVIFILEKFCDVHEYDMPGLETMFQENGIPSLMLEVDITIPVGQFRTRIEAFLETLTL